MKKIALNFSGALRTFNCCAESIKINIIDELRKKYDVHLFGDFWILKNADIKDSLTSTMKWKKDNDDSIDLINNYGFANHIIEEFDNQQEYKTISECGGQVILDEYSKIDDPEERKKWTNYAINCMGMYYKIKKVQILMESYEEKKKFKFDYVIRIRPDFYWHEKIPINIMDELVDGKIGLVKDSYCIKAKWMGNDKFFMGSNKVMKQYSRVYDKLVDFYKEGIRVEGQNMGKRMIEFMNLSIVFFGSDKTYDKATDTFIKNYNLLSPNK